MSSMSSCVGPQEAAAEILRNRTAAPVPCALLSMCCLPFPVPHPPCFLSLALHTLCSAQSSPPPTSLAIWAFLHWGRRIGHKTQPPLAGPMPVPGFDVISMWQRLCRLVGLPALVASALCPCGIISIMKPLSAPARIPHSTPPDPRFSYSFLFFCSSAHGQSTRNGMSHSCVGLPLCLPRLPLRLCTN